MTVRILKGDCRQVLRELPDESVHCVVTSPPYFGLRDYGVAGQLGLEAGKVDVGAQQASGWLAQNAAQLSAQIAATNQANQLAALTASSQMMLGLADPFSEAATQQYNQMLASLQAMGLSGDELQATAQAQFDAMYQDFLRQMGLSEEGAASFIGMTPTSSSTDSTTSTSTGGLLQGGGFTGL